MVSETLKVLVRVRPQPQGSQGGTSLTVSGKSISVRRDKKGITDFAFSEGAVLGADSDQSDLFSHCDVAQDVVGGLNCCIMAYGQTSSGKTHSMYGRGWEEDAQADMQLSENPIDNGGLGVVPRSIASLFSLLDMRAAASDDFSFNVTCQVLQIYNERIFDLLGDKQRENPLQLREVNRKGKGRSSDFGSVHIPGLSGFRVSTREDVSALLQKGLRNRAIRATDFNAESSRSHTILQLFVETEFPDDQGLVVLRRSIFSLVDLAGSEKWRPSLDAITSTKSQHADAMRRQEQEKEMVNINSSLAALGNVVSALLEPGRRHIPYRDSSLTRLLQDSLGGHGRTIIVATVHEDSQYVEETFSTLSFASRASRIKVSLQISENIGESITLEGAKRQILLLRARIQELTGGIEACSISQSEINRLAGKANPKCVSCVDLVERMKSLLTENMQLRAKMGHVGDAPKAIETSPERRGILQSMLAPLGLYKSNPPDSIQSPTPTKPNLSIKVSQRTTTMSMQAQEYNMQYGLGSREAPSPANVGSREVQSSARTLSKTKEVAPLNGDERINGRQPSPKGTINQQQSIQTQPRSAEAALAAAKMALSQTDISASQEMESRLQPQVGNQSPRHTVAPMITANIHAPSSPISSPKHGSNARQSGTTHIPTDASALQIQAQVRASVANFSLPERYAANSPGSLASQTSSLTGSLVSLGGSLEGSVLLSSAMNSPTPTPVGQYDSSRIERLIQGSERTLDAAHKGRNSSDMPSIQEAGPGSDASVSPNYNKYKTTSYGFPSGNAHVSGRSPTYAELAAKSDGSSVNVTGSCIKHGLDECILCLMFNERRQPSSNPARSSYETNEISKPLQYSYNNIDRMGDITSSVTAFQESLGIAPKVQSTPSHTFGGFQRPVVTGALCMIHGVRDCLLCSLKKSSSGGATAGSYVPYNSGTSSTLASVRGGGSNYPVSSSTNGVPVDTPTTKISNPSTQQRSYGIYKPQSDSEDENLGEDDNVGNANFVPTNSISSNSGYMPCNSYNSKHNQQQDQQYTSQSQYQYMQNQQFSNQSYGASKIVYEEDNTRLRSAEMEYDYDEDERYIPSAPHPVSQNQTRGHSVPSSTASGLYDEYDTAPVEAYTHQAAPIVQQAPSRKKRASALSANSRMQKENIHANASKDSDTGYAQEMADSDLAGYLYHPAPAAHTMTRKANNGNNGSSLPELAPARSIDAGRVHNVIAAKQQATRAGNDQSIRRTGQIAGVVKKTEKKKKVRGAPVLGGLVSRRK